MIITPFPEPPDDVVAAMSRLRTLRTGDPAAIAKLPPHEQLNRPWEPATCPARLRAHIWWWCDDVAAWLNHDYAWRPEHTIPACWPAHPHIAHELPVLACLRVEAEAALDADALEAWHHDVLPDFLDRLATRLGGSSCRTGTHTDWPAAARYDTYFSEASVADRQGRIHDDSGHVLRDAP